jgi:hypothetical protein
MDTLFAPAKTTKPPALQPKKKEPKKKVCPYVTVLDINS